jgi:hypothetical protein
MSTKAQYLAGALTHYDPAKNYVWTRRETRYQHRDEFDAYTSIPGDGSRANGTPWVQDITGSGPPTVALGTDLQSQAVTCALEATDEQQDATIHYDDNRHLDVSKNLVVQFVAQLSVLPTLLGTAHLGIAGDHAAAYASTTYNILFTFAAAGVCSIRIDDNDAVKTAATGVTLTVATDYVFRIECFDATKIRFYINGAYVCGTTDTPYVATGANAILQPFCGVNKASGAGVGSLLIRSFNAWQD